MQMLDRHHPLPGGDRIRLRLPHVTDRARVHEFLERLGLSAHELDVRRGLRWTADRRWTLIATRWNGACEQIVGIATADGEDGAPTLLAEDPAVCDLLSRALAEHAGSSAPRRFVA